MSADSLCTSHAYDGLMPELPEVERVRRTIERALVGLQVASVTVHRRDVVTGPGDPPGGWGRASEAFRQGPKPRLCKAMLLEGSTIEAVSRHGKQLALFADHGAVGVHLGMTGQLLYRPPGVKLEKPDHVHVQWRLMDAAGSPAGRLVFRDPRRFGGVWAHRSGEELRALRWEPLGPDALEITPERLQERLTPRQPARTARSVRCIKAALLDQQTIAGVGNIYADEALFGAGIRPTRPASQLGRTEASRLAKEIRQTLEAAIEAGGSTLRDYVDGDGAKGSFQSQHRVYGRSGRMCIRCGYPLQTALVAQRTTVWCETCQC